MIESIIRLKGSETHWTIIDKVTIDGNTHYVLMDGDNDESFVKTISANTPFIVIELNLNYQS